MKMQARLPRQGQLPTDLEVGTDPANDMAVRYPFGQLAEPVTVELRRAGGAVNDRGLADVESIATRCRIRVRAEVPDEFKQLTPDALLHANTLKFDLIDKESFPYGESVRLGLFSFMNNQNAHQVADVLNEAHWHPADVFLLLAFGNRFFPQDFVHRGCTKQVSALGMRCFNNSEVVHPVLVPDTANASWSLRMLPVWKYLTSPDVLVLAWSRS
jgi:hypothetical protein